MLALSLCVCKCVCRRQCGLDFVKRHTHLHARGVPFCMGQSSISHRGRSRLCCAVLCCVAASTRVTLSLGEVLHSVRRIQNWHEISLLTKLLKTPKPSSLSRYHGLTRVRISLFVSTSSSITSIIPPIFPYQYHTRFFGLSRTNRSGLFKFRDAHDRFTISPSRDPTYQSRHLISERPAIFVPQPWLLESSRPRSILNDVITT